MGGLRLISACLVPARGGGVVLTRPMASGVRMNAPVAFSSDPSSASALARRPRHTRGRPRGGSDGAARRLRGRARHGRGAAGGSASSHASR